MIHRFAAALVLGSLGSLILVTSGLDRPVDGATWSALLFLVVALALTIRLQKSFFGDPIHLALFSYVIFVGIGRLCAPSGYSSSALGGTNRSLLLSWAGFGALLGGYLVGRVVESGGQDDHRRTSRLNINPDVLGYFGIIYTVIGAVGLALYLNSVGGLDHLLDTAYGLRDGPSGFYSGAYDLLRPGLFLLVAWASCRARLPVGWTLILLLYCIADVIWFGPLRGSRHHIITLVLTVAYLARASEAHRIRSGPLFLVRRWLVLAGLFLVLIWGGLRIYSLSQIAAIGGSKSAISSELRLDVTSGVTMAIYEPYDTFSRITETVPSLLPYLKGSSFWDSLTVFVPRALWRSKPTSFGDWLSTSLYGSASNGNTVPTWPGELYLNFGVPGLLGGMFLTGLLCTKAAKWSDRSRGFALTFRAETLLYAVTFPLLFDWMWGGSNAATWYVFTNVLPVCLAVWLARPNNIQNPAYAP